MCFYIYLLFYFILFATLITKNILYALNLVFSATCMVQQDCLLRVMYAACTQQKINSLLYSLSFDCIAK